MPQNKNQAFTFPWELNPGAEPPMAAGIIGTNKSNNGFEVANEMAYDGYKERTSGKDPDLPLGRVCSQPRRASRESLVNNPDYAHFQLADRDPASVEEYIVVNVKVPEDTMSIRPPSDFVETMKINDITLANKKYAEMSTAHEQCHAEFIMPINNESAGSMIIPEMGDMVKVKYIDGIKSGGYIEEVTLKWSASPKSLEDLKANAPDQFQRLSMPISSVFKSDQGPVAKKAENPADISNLAPGPNVQVGTGETISTVVIDNKLIDKRVAPHLVAMYRDAAAANAGINSLTSAFRVGFIKDNIKLEDLNALTQGTKYTDWDGNPYKKATRVPSSQEALRYKNCGVNGMDRDVKCDIATAYPVRPGAWEGKKKSGHMMGNGIDVPVGSWGGRPSSKIKSASPHLLTKQYRWLSLNAWKYGFIRTVRSERWHWEFLPGKGQFSRVPRDNPLWDSQFNEGFANYGEDE